jgi:lysozyme
MNFINNVSPSEINLPPAIDLEFVGNCDSLPDLKILENEISVFIKSVTEYYNTEPVIYLTKESFEKLYRKMDLDLKIWIRSVIGKPNLRDGYEWKFWQFSPRGRISGVNGYVDLNVYCYDSI